MKRAVLQVLDAVLAFSPPPDDVTRQFHVEWQEPMDGRAAESVKRFQQQYLEGLPESKRTYVECSLPRYRFLSAAAVRHFPQAGEILDLGCAPGHMGILLHDLGFEVHGIDLNQLWEATYPDRKWLGELHVRAVNAEKEPLPFPDASFDGALFAEVLEHIAVAPPQDILREIARVLKPGAVLLLTTPNVCNLANILALAKGKNIFWAPEIFYGGTDRHNREYTPAEVIAAVRDSGLEIVQKFLFNGPNNWNAAGAEHMYETLDLLRGLDHPLLGNTVFVAARRPANAEAARG
ncbi:MAG TPA: methyltransferase domain-containing protein [Candidatus Binatia bacterium]|nr:methyltransferase domain-containing protein [Candidatus Binatia bacterium]